MIIDFKDLLLQHYRDIEFDIPMVADVVEAGSEEINRVVETMLITNAAVRAAVDAGLDPMVFSIMNREEYRSGGILFFSGGDEDWEYRLAGSKPLMQDTPIVDVMRKTDDMDHWQIWDGGVWNDNCLPIGFLDRMNGDDSY